MLTVSIDTPFPIDPFNFVSAPIEQQQSGLGVGPSGQTADGFVIPALPPHLAKLHSFVSSSSSSATSPAGVSSSSPAAAAGEKPKRSTVPPRNPFPEVHMPHLLARIDALATSSLLGIVDTVHRELQVHKVKKNAIEAKVREVGEKCKEKKVWVVKADVRVSTFFLRTSRSDRLMSACVCVGTVRAFMISKRCWYSHPQFHYCNIYYVRHTVPECITDTTIIPEL